MAARELRRRADPDGREPTAAAIAEGSRFTTCSATAARTGSSTRRWRCPPRDPRSRRWPPSTIRRHGSSARSSTCSASWPAGTPTPGRWCDTRSGRTTSFPSGRTPPPASSTTTAGPFRSRRSAARASTRSRWGPVHAGIIEPGHFRFSVVGETIIDMKSRLYFTHKGTEKLFEGRDARATGSSWPSACPGDTSVGHALAYCQAVEALSGDRRAAPGAVPSRDPARARAPLQPRRRLRDDRQRHGLRAWRTPTASASASGSCA